MCRPSYEPYAVQIVLGPQGCPEYVPQGAYREGVAGGVIVEYHAPAIVMPVDSA